ncbi:glycosyltransferase family 2 protein [Empedobacter falsenii]|uniref:Putative glycosyl transferase n=1 Tax=Empedobacter falsenii TaxID=343874 RepID=A0A376G0E8_9FLAO|nr:glycosyltransferase [Empedobacter falsenii]STD53411.1 putative glycosyl transferase [Empedobacter falsenii]
MKNKPLLSIAIATKNREKYCIETIKSILNYKDPRIEIAVADNSDTNAVQVLVNEINSPQVKYLYDNTLISSIDNFNRAMELATGEYVILIGDDDSIHYKIMEVVEWMKTNDIESVCSKDTFTFLWPGAHPNFPNGNLSIPNFKDSYTIADPQKEIIKLLNNGLVNYFFYKVPKSYHGIVKKSLMNEVKVKTGNYYGALSPDIFSVVSLSLLIKKHAVLDYPISIAGVCPTSTTSDQIKGKHSGDLKDMPHLKNRKIPYNWDKLVPEIYSVPTTWADSGLNALSAMNREDLRAEFNYYPLIAHTILINRNFFLKYSIKKSEEFRKLQKTPFLVFWYKASKSVFRLLYDKFKLVSKSKKEGSVLSYSEMYNFQNVFEKINTIDFYKS